MGSQGITVLDADSLGSLDLRRAGLVLGYSMADEPGLYQSLAEELSEAFSVPTESGYLETADAVIETGTTEEQVRAQIRKTIGDSAASHYWDELAKGHYGAALLTVLDRRFEEALRAEAARRAARQQPTVIDNLSQEPPPRTVPVFKLLGSADREEFASSRPSYLARRASWRGRIRTFSHRVKGRPVIIVGMRDAEWLLLDILSELFGEQSFSPSQLLFHKTDVDSSLGKIERMLSARGRVSVVDCPYGEMASALLVQPAEAAPSAIAGKGKTGLSNRLKRRCNNYFT